MGFNLGSTRIRTLWTGDTERYYFESPLVRLMKDFKYTDVYSAGLNNTEIDKVPPGSIDPRSITIYRYYDQVSSLFGKGKQVDMEDFGHGLSDLIIKLRDRICLTDADKADFKVYLLGHSMGGLVIRCFLQNDEIGDQVAKKYVDKVFTYATPHNGIELEIIGNVPAFFTAQSANNFNRNRMKKYLGLPARTERVNTLNGKFDVDRFFCLVGTNPKDYTVAAGWSTRLVGPFSDGLVRLDNAVVFDGKDGEKGYVKACPPRLRLSQPLRLLRNRQFRGGLPKPDTVPVRKFSGRWQPGSAGYHAADRCGAGAKGRKGGARLLSIRGRGAGAGRALGFEPPSRQREFRAVSKIRRTVSECSQAGNRPPQP
jgi:hypothetical protein